MYGSCLHSMTWNGIYSAVGRLYDSRHAFHNSFEGHISPVWMKQQCMKDHNIIHVHQAEQSRETFFNGTVNLEIFVVKHN